MCALVYMAITTRNKLFSNCPSLPPQVEEETYVDQFKPFMMDIVFEWCNGMSFLELCKKTDIFEGECGRADPWS